ncbi:MAG: DNA translocase FtsK 4TM domain-containing protein [Alphaproteobacteria bacterium]|nr:DNA translocase FtsK 4TM domain-containing protein [Alphaproteobacteria bacterium]
MSSRLLSHRVIHERSKSNRQLLPDSLREFLIRRICEIGGVLLFAVAAALWISLLTYNSNDPSLNTAANTGVENIHNWLGRPGSFIGDLLQQSFGLGSYLLVIIMVAWAWRVATLRGLSPFLLRLAAAILTLSFSAVALQSLVIGLGSNFSPLSIPIGGFIGQFTLAISQHYMLPKFIMLTIAVLQIVMMLATLYLCCGLSLDEWHIVLRFIQRVVVHIGAFMWWAVETAYARIAHQDVSEAPKLDLQADDDDEDESLLDVVEEKPSKAKTKIKAAPKKAKKPIQTRMDFSRDRGSETLPPLQLLQMPDTDRNVTEELSEADLQKNARMLEGVLGDFGVQGKISEVSPGPVVTLYELEPAPGIKSSRVIGLADDIARSMSALSVRVAVVPGRNVIGIELPNRTRETVYLRELLMSQAYSESSCKLPLAMGKDIGGSPVVADLARMPHLLVAGTTGSGKSVAINTMILSLLYRYSPRECRFIMVDPKMLELSVYEGIPHLLAPVVTEPKKAVVALKWTVREMEERYRAMSKLGVRNIDGYNMRVKEARDRGETLMRKVQTGFDPDTGKPIFEDQPLDLKDLPFIVVIVDEMADLMIVAGKDIEATIQRLAQMARAAGIHIIMATQRPSVDVITGTIKANFPSRVSFQVTSKIDSRTILGEQGAEQLLGQGDMLYMAGGGRITRVHGPFVSDKEVEEVVNFLKEQGGEPEYLEEITQETEGGDGESTMIGSNTSSGDELYDKAVDIVLRERKASTSFIQRHLQIGYNRAARLMEQMEKEGVVGAPNHVGKREILGRSISDD